MKVSSLTSGSIQVTLNSDNVSEKSMQLVQGLVKSLFDTLNHMGTSIALCEKCDLEAADAYRRKNSGK